MKARVLTSLTVAFIIGHIPAAADWQYTYAPVKTSENDRL
jgi:hypothetical protein